MIPFMIPFSLPDNSVEFRLPRGYISIINEIDVDLLEVRWSVNVGKLGAVYVRHGNRINGVYKEIFLHRVILERVLSRSLLPNEKVDHKDTDSLNNRRENLRLASYSQNSQNRNRPINNTSGYKGVTWNKSSKKWQASLEHQGECHYLGLFDDPAVAHEAYKKRGIAPFR